MLPKKGGAAETEGVRLFALGRLIALAVTSGIPLTVRFSRSLFKVRSAFARACPVSLWYLCYSCVCASGYRGIRHSTNPLEIVQFPKRPPLSVAQILLGEEITADEVARIDPHFAEHRIAALLKPGGVAELEDILCEELTFVSVPGEASRGEVANQTVDLLESGSKIRVTEKSKVW